MSTKKLQIVGSIMKDRYATEEYVDNVVANNKELTALSTLITEEVSSISARVDLYGVLVGKYQTINVYNDTTYNQIQFMYNGNPMWVGGRHTLIGIHVYKYTDENNLTFQMYGLNGTNREIVIVDGGVSASSTNTFAMQKDVILRGNKVEYIPDTDYSPATKKYVDDAVLNIPEQVQTDWEQTDSTQPSFLVNRPFGNIVTSSFDIEITGKNTAIAYVSGAELSFNIQSDGDYPIVIFFDGCEVGSGNMNIFSTESCNVRNMTITISVEVKAMGLSIVFTGKAFANNYTNIDLTVTYGTGTMGEGQRIAIASDFFQLNRVKTISPEWIPPLEYATEEYVDNVVANIDIPDISAVQLTTEQISALDALFRKCKYISDATSEYEAFKVAFGITEGEIEQDDVSVVYDTASEALTVENTDCIYNEENESMTISSDYATYNESNEEIVIGGN